LVLCADNPAVTAMTATDVRAGHRAPAPVVAYSEPATLEIDPPAARLRKSMLEMSTS
jgi:hypothetical protein